MGTYLRLSLSAYRSEPTQSLSQRQMVTGSLCGQKSISLAQHGFGEKLEKEKLKMKNS